MYGISAARSRSRRTPPRFGSPAVAHRSASTSARSLSPRPERQIKSSVPAGLASAHAIAWADSSAGMIPSLRASGRTLQRLLVGDGDVAARRCRAAARAPARPGVVEPGGDGVRLEDLPVLVGQHADSEPCRTPGTSAAVSGAPWRPVSRPRRRLDADQLDLGVVEEAGEDADRVRAAADAGDHAVGSRPSRSSIWARASSPIVRWSSRTTPDRAPGRRRCR